MNIVIAGPADCPRLATARVIAETARRKYAALDAEVVTLDPEHLSFISDVDGQDWTGVMQMTQALLNVAANRVFVMDSEGLGRFLGTFPAFELGRVHNLELEALNTYVGDTNAPEYFIEVFDALATSLIRLFKPGLATPAEARNEADALWYFIFSTVFD